MANQIVPLTSKPNQKFNVSLNIDGGVRTLNLSISFNEMAGYWIMAVADQFNNMIIDSVPMISGEYPAANLWEQYAYLAIGACYMINVSQSPTDSANQTNLGSDFILLWTDTPIS